MVAMRSRLGDVLHMTGVRCDYLTIFVVVVVVVPSSVFACSS